MSTAKKAHNGMCPVRLFDGLHCAPVLWKHPDVTMPHTQCIIPHNRCACNPPDCCRPCQAEALASAEAG